MNRNKYYNIYLVFSKTGTWLSRLICMFSQIKYPHVSISFDRSFTKMYSFGRTNPDNPFSGGFVEENLYGGVYKKFSRSKCIIYQVKVTEEQYITLHNQVEKFCRNKKKYKYNFLGLVGVICNRPIKRQYYYFCSQFIAEILINSNIITSEKIPALIRSDELLTIINNKVLIYEGFINADSKAMEQIKVGFTG